MWGQWLWDWTVRSHNVWMEHCRVQGAVLGAGHPGWTLWSSHWGRQALDKSFYKQILTWAVMEGHVMLCNPMVGLTGSGGGPGIARS